MVPINNESCKNITVIINETIYPAIEPNSVFGNNIDSDIAIIPDNNSTNKCENSTLNQAIQIGFFITLAFTLLCFLMIAWKCCLRDMLEEFIDDVFFCGCRNNLQICKTVCGICMECCEDERENKRERREQQIERSNKIEMNIIQQAVYDEEEGKIKTIKRVHV